MTSVVKADSAAAILALVSYLLDYEPRNSLVLITFAGKRSQAVLRINLPKSTNPAVLKRIVTQALGTLCKVPGIDAILAVVYCDEPFGDEAPYRLLADTVICRIRSMGFEERGALCRAGDAWGSYLDESTPRGGHPLSELVPPAELATLANRFERTPDADPAAKDAMRIEVLRLRALPEVDPDSDELEPLDDATYFLDEALDWNASERKKHGPLLLTVLQAPEFRDKTMVQWSTSLAVSDVMWDNDSDIANRMIGHGPRPDQNRIEQGIDVLDFLLSLADDELRLSPLCMIAWLHWTQGRSSIAGTFIAEAISIKPQHGMANLLGSILAGGMLPEWIFERPER